MIWQTSPFVPVLLLTALACAILGISVWRHRPSPGVAPCVASFIATAGWNAGYAMELSSANYAAQLFWANVQYVFIAAMPAVMIVFAIIYTGRGVLLSRRVALALAVEPVITVILAFVSQTVPLLRTGGERIVVDGYVMVAWTYGPFFWIHTIYSYGLMATATILLVPVILRSPHLYRLQAATVVLGVTMPWIANAVYLSGLSPFPHLDLTPFSFFIYALAVGWGLLRLQFLDVVPVARGKRRGRTAGRGARHRHERVYRRCQPGCGGASGSRWRRTRGTAVDGSTGEPDRGPRPGGAGAGGERGDAGRPPRTKIPGLELRQAAVVNHCGRPRGRVAVLHDLTERKRAEEVRVRSQRLLAAGELAAGIAHNLNNILVGILAPAQRLQDGETDQLARDADIIVSAAQRARDLVQRLNHGGAGDDVIANEPVDVATVIADAIEAARPRWEDSATTREEITLSTQIETLPAARCDRTGLHNAVLNLILNATDAMPGGGSLTIDAEMQAERIVVSVTDTGTGMDADTVRRVFEAFFTTKVDVGTGLGLTTVYRSVQRWGGDVTVDSSPGEGSTFRLFLPVWEGEPVVRQPMAPRSAGDGTVRIMIVEDEPIVATILSECVRPLGYEVEVIADGLQALEQLSRGDVDVAVLDLGIPGLSGDNVARQARERDPRLTTVLMTGWWLAPEDERMRHFDFLLQKPFDVKQARRVIDNAVAMSRLRHDTTAKP